MELQEIKLWRWLFGGLTAALVVFAVTSETVVADTMFHLMRVECLAEHLAAGGGYPCRLYAAACNGYGYAAPLFYCDFFLLPFALLRALGASLYVCHVLLLLTLPVLVGTLMWRMSGWFGLKGERRLLCTGIYLFAPSLLLSLYNFEQVGGVFAAAFLPCVVFPALVLLTESEISRERLVSACRWLCLGIVGIVLSHLISSVIVALFLLVMGVLRLPFLLWHRGRIIALGVVATIALGLTAWFWIPLLEQYSAHLLCFDMGPKSAFAENAMRLPGLFLPWKVCLDLLAPRWGEYWAVPGETFSLWGWILLPAIVALIHRAKSFSLPLWAWFASGICGILLPFFSLRPLLALMEPFFGWMQFPSRFFPLWTCLMAPLLACLICSCQRKWIRFTFGAGLLLAALCTFTYPVAKRVDTYLFGHKHIQQVSYQIGYGEYLPTRWVQARAQRGIDPYSGFYFQLPPVSRDNSADGSLTVALTKPTSHVSLPRFYYKGYAATLDGAPCPIRESEEGCVTAVTANRMGTLHVWYAGTPAQRIATWVSVGSFVGLLLLMVGCRIGIGRLLVAGNPARPLRKRIIRKA